jgi:hypothetical protein
MTITFSWERIMTCRPTFLAVVVLLPFAGCLETYEVKAPPPPPKAAAAPKSDAQKPSAPKSDAQTRPAQTGTPVSSPSLPVQLSAGVALPQTLPDGTAMGFSVDYQFVQGQPDPNTAYVWVIERSQGAPSRQSVKLSPRGTLQGFVSEIRPEEGPFQTHLEDGRGNRLSPTIPLR